MFGEDGLHATLVDPAAVELAGRAPGGRAELLLEGGERVFVPIDLLAERAGGGYSIALGRDALLGTPTSKGGGNVNNLTDVVVLPVVEERLHVEKHEVETGRVTVRLTHATRREAIDVTLEDMRAEVERVPVNRMVDRAEPPREEGDVTIVPVYEEVVVVERRLMLKEEIHIRRHRTQRREHHEVELRTGQVDVRRAGPDEIDERTDG